MFSVISSTAKMPAKVKAPYRHVAVIEHESDCVPTRIDTRQRGVTRIVQVWRNCHRGHNPQGNTAFDRAMREARAMAEKLNQETRKES